MKVGDIVFYAVFANGGYTHSDDWNRLHKEQACCTIAKTYGAIYGYGIHATYDIINEQREPSSMIIGDYEVLKFYTTGNSYNFYLRVEFKDRRTGNLYKCDLTTWEDSKMPIGSVMKFLQEVGEYESFDTYRLTKRVQELERENQRLKDEIIKLKTMR